LAALAGLFRVRFETWFLTVLSCVGFGSVGPAETFAFDGSVVWIGSWIAAVFDVRGFKMRNAPTDAAKQAAANKIRAFRSLLRRR